MKTTEATSVPLPPRLRRRLSAIFIAVLLSVGFAVSPINSAEAYYGEAYYSVPYSGTLYNAYGSSAYPAEFNDWAADGYPQPIPARTEYVKYSWSASIYAVSYMSSATFTKQLAFSEWQRAGSPNPRTAGHVDGTSYHKWDTSGELFATSPDGITHKLTYPEWAASGFRSPEYLVNEGYQKLSWSNSIAYMYSVASGDGYPIGYAEWQKQGFPTPQSVQRFPNDEFCKYPWSSDIYYYGPSDSMVVTYSQWRAAGFPAPTNC